MLKNVRGAIFDLDGVLVDTARYHYIAWKELADRLGFVFTEEHNERLKGVSRMRSLEILLEVGGVTADDATKEAWAAEKNDRYLALLHTLTEEDLLPGAREVLQYFRLCGVKTALGSASRNAMFILEKLGIADLFDAIIDGTVVSQAKPDPEVFVKGVEAIGVPAAECVVFEDALAGIEAAHGAGCRAIAIGDSSVLPGAEAYASCLRDVLNDLLAHMSPKQDAVTFCNPMDLSYVYQSEYRGRELADPAVVTFQNTYYLFASHGHGYWWSDDLADWHFVYVDWSAYGEFGKFAPAACEHDGYLYVTHSNFGDILRSADPKVGEWEYVSHPEEWCDPALFKDADGKMYCYYGCSPSWPIQVVELDTENQMAKLCGPIDCLNSDKPARGFEIVGDDNTRYDGDCWVEGAWMTSYNGKYYLQYAAPGTEYECYADGCFVGDTAVGPFEYCENSPIVFKNSGFMRGAGHGSLIQDHRGNWWKYGTVCISRNHIFERRLVMSPARFDEHGQLVTNMVRADYPLYRPMCVEDHFFTPGPDWELISYAPTVAASSSLEGHGPELAFNESMRDWWSAETGDAGEWVSGDLGEPVTVYALQVNFADQDVQDVSGRDNEYRYRYLLEFSLDGEHWFAAMDRSNAQGERFAAVDLSHEYMELEQPVVARYVRLTNKGEVPAGGRFAVSGIRLFGYGFGKAPQQAPQFSVERHADDRRAVTVSWEPVEGAEGYVVRFGNHADSMCLHTQVIGGTSATIRILNRDVAYYFTVDAYNRNGRICGETIEHCL